jgi:integrase
MLTRVAPAGLLQRSVGTVTASDVERVLVGLLADGAHSSVVRFRASLRGFFTWAVRNGYRADNPVSSALMPRRTEPRREMHPWSAEELEARYGAWAGLNVDAAEVARFLGLTGLRWSEARALLVSDVSLVPYPSVLVQRARPEGTAVKTTKNTQHRRVPLAAPVVPYVRARMAGRSGSDLLLPPLHRGRWTTQLRWTDTAGGRTIHDLRHTAICIWIVSGVDLATVRAWAGHSDLSITSRYVHYLGSAADRASLARLNAGLASPADGPSEDAAGA